MIIYNICDNIFGRYVGFESHNTRSSHEPRRSRISPGLYNKYKEINFAPMSENRISGNGDRFNQNDFVIDTRESAKSCQDLSEPSQESFYNSSGIDQGCGPHIIHNTSSGTSKDSVKITTLNIKSRTELTWWIENLRFCNDRTFSQLNSQVIIKTDASLTGWGAVCHGVQTSGQLSEEERSLHINVLELLAIKLALFSFT